jgi:hypothetical protein
MVYGLGFRVYGLGLEIKPQTLKPLISVCIFLRVIYSIIVPSDSTLDSLHLTG